MATIAFAFCMMAAVVPAAFQGAPRKPVPPVAPAALEALLPALDGWTKGRVSRDRIMDAESCTYVFADAVYTSGATTLRLTLADTGFVSDGLMALATIVEIFPADHTEVIPPDTVISRLTHGGSPAGTVWNGVKREGEFIVVVGGRFVAKVEGTKIDSLEILRAAIEKVDLKKLAELDR